MEPQGKAVVHPCDTRLRPQARKRFVALVPGFGGLSAGSGIRRSIDPTHRNDLTAESAFMHGQSPWASAKADRTRSLLTKLSSNQ